MDQRLSGTGAERSAPRAIRTFKCLIRVQPFGCSGFYTADRRDADNESVSSLFDRLPWNRVWPR